MVEVDLGRHLTDEKRLETLKAVSKTNLLAEAARLLGVPDSTMRSRVRVLTTEGYIKNFKLTQRGVDYLDDDLGVEMPLLPAEDVPAETILDHMQVRLEQKLDYFRALKWFEIKIKDKKSLPYGLCFVGDPHLGPRCNIPLLRRDIKILRETPGIGCVNLGDTTDNWSFGRLVTLWAQTDSSQPTERILAKWFLEEGPPWLVWCEGNHDLMHDTFTTFLRTQNARRIPMVDWRAQFCLTFANGEKFRIDAAHDFKGSSIWNDIHSLERAAKRSNTELAEVYAAGHRHLSEFKKVEMEDGQVVSLLRARGYAWLDEYAHRHQFAHKKTGATVMCILNPHATTPDDRTHVFTDLERGAKTLTRMREEYS